MPCVKVCSDRDDSVPLIPIISEIISHGVTRKHVRCLFPQRMTREVMFRWKPH